MVVAELMRTDVRAIGARGTLAEAVAAMLNTQVSALPVLDEEGRPVGVVTNREILAATLGNGAHDAVRSPDLIPVEEFMAPWPAVAHPQMEVDDAARMMSYLDLKRLFVVDEDRLVGVISQTDIVDAFATARYAAL